MLVHIFGYTEVGNQVVVSTHTPPLNDDMELDDWVEENATAYGISEVIDYQAEADNGDELKPWSFDYPFAAEGMERD